MKIIIVCLEAFINTLVSLHSKELNVDYVFVVCSLISLSNCFVLSTAAVLTMMGHCGQWGFQGLAIQTSFEVEKDHLLSLPCCGRRWSHTNIKPCTLHMHCVQEIYSPGHGRHQQAEERGHTLR